jgi:hypothetical protein
LGATLTNEEVYVKAKFALLSEFLQHEPLKLKAMKVVQLGLPHQPVWTVEFSLSDSFRDALSDAFDPIMCAELNGLFLWKADEKRPGAIVNLSPHVTVGPTDNDKETALALVGCTFIFAQMDYKRVGKHDPHVSLSLAK